MSELSEQDKWYQDLDKFNEVPASRLGRVCKEIGKRAAIVWMVITSIGTDPEKLGEEYKSKYWKPGDMMTVWTQFDPHPTYSQEEIREAFEVQSRDACKDSDGGTYIF
jgi:hypothetical protein